MSGSVNTKIIDPARELKASLAALGRLCSRAGSIIFVLTSPPYSNYYIRGCKWAKVKRTCKQPSDQFLIGGGNFNPRKKKKTSPCSEYPLEPHFYVVKLGYAGVYLFFLIFAPKHRLWVLVRTASPRRF